MYLRIKNKKYDVKELKSFKDRFKSLKFNLSTLDHVLYFPKKKLLDTYFFCQRVDAIFTDNDNKILYIHSNIKSEKRIIHFKAKNIYIMPLKTCSNYKIGEILKIKKED